MEGATARNITRAASIVVLLGTSASLTYAQSALEPTPPEPIPPAQSAREDVDEGPASVAAEAASTSPGSIATEVSVRSTQTASPEALSEQSASEQAPAEDAGYRPTWRLVLVGANMFVLPYLGGLIAAATDATHARDWLFVPVAGYSAFAASRSDLEGLAVLLHLGTLAQTVGVVLLTLGFALQDSRPRPNRKQPLAAHVFPFAGPDGGGLLLSGRY